MLCTLARNMKTLIHHFPTCYAYSVKKTIGKLNLERALDEDTGVSSFFLCSTEPHTYIITYMYNIFHAYDTDLKWNCYLPKWLFDQRESQYYFLTPTW